MKKIKNLKGGSLSETCVIEQHGEKRVRKYCSFYEQREFGLVRWQSQIRKQQHLLCLFPNQVAPILEMGVDKDRYYYDLPYYENFVDGSVFIENSDDHENFSYAVKNIVGSLSEHKLGNVVGSISVYIKEEMLNRIGLASSRIEEIEALIPKSLKLEIEESIKKCVSKLESLITEFESVSVEETLSHGNLTLENILWSETEKKLILIDSYSETYTENICGDISQLSQSSTYGYEYIVKTNRAKFQNNDAQKIPRRLVEFGSKIEEFAQHDLRLDMRLLKIFQASQFLRMFPFKFEANPEAAYYFLNLGTKILRQV